MVWTYWCRLIFCGDKSAVGRLILIFQCSSELLWPCNKGLLLIRNASVYEILLNMVKHEFIQCQIMCCPSLLFHICHMLEPGQCWFFKTGKLLSLMRDIAKSHPTLLYLAVPPTRIQSLQLNHLVAMFTVLGVSVRVLIMLTQVS